MSARTHQILRDAMELSVSERAEVAAQLLASLDGEPDADVEAAWTSEIERRAREANETQKTTSRGTPCATN